MVTFLQIHPLLFGIDGGVHIELGDRAFVGVWCWGTLLKGLGGGVLTDTSPVVGGQPVSWFAYTGEGTFLIHTLLFTTTIIRQTFIHIYKRIQKS